MTEKAISLLVAAGVKKTDIFETLDAAVKAIREDGPKCWAVLPANGVADAPNEVLKALKDGGSQLCIIAAATSAPVTQGQVLRAMEYGEVYVAAAEFEGKAEDYLKEALTYSGPAVLLFASQAAARGDAGWTSFSYDPRREEASGSAFSCGSEKVRKEIQAFLDRENLLTLVAKSSLPDDSQGDEAAGDLANGVADASKTVTVLYGSDTGHAEECAKAVARQCRNGGFANSAVRCCTADSFDVGAVANEPMIVFCIATAGKGEFCGNGRTFYERLLARADEFKGTFTNVKYAVFGLGDSHYWGKGTEESRVNFAKPARELDALMESLGAIRFIPTGFGDDQDVDQYHTGFGEWKSQLYSRLGVEAATAAAGDDDGPVKSDEVIKIETNQLRGTLKAA
eukprot:CAMPEP_0206581854 /NCGR_PEP_ID=MMETSP0325_2-20121206/34103_1 /ASSEMBLY_ACC=CAM_ASM_000347 /TAXON_ID=2866 /ORGANISM="Crypthecodinium cohnii, Strain Seligo" /LENGTH=396 /DNA_ID=CAMNT_0054088357 /DNA_START=1 /DNA_END=1188 /DNA_ORIENTATION=+